MTNLLNELTEQDRDTIREYIYAYGGVRESTFIGLDQWLYHWAGANKTLFKLLGNKLIYEFPIDYEKTRFQLVQEFRGIIYGYDSFVDIYSCFIHHLEDKKLVENKQDKWALEDILSLDTLVADKIEKTIKLSRPESKKILQLQEGMKPIKAVSKILKYYEDLWVPFCDNFKKSEGKVDPVKDFEDFRIKHSMILNDKHTKGTMCISIHPMDFMTMSDNASDWSSCMSWKNAGCYRIGTVEMMNSNCVLCCYIKGKNDFTFNKGEEHWNNKRWRILAYYNKDIIMSGKPYPFYNEALCKIVIAKIKELAETNLGRKFSFGPELYKDMIHIDSAGKMDQNRYWMEYNDIKNNIIWDTNGMYNDMLNDTDMSYWCYRNKVEHKKIYNVSGKAPCLCCGKSVIERSEWIEDYNDRFDNVDALLCNPCYNKYYCNHCHKTGEEVMEATFLSISENDPVTRRYCRKCMPKAIKVCPCCHRPMDMNLARASFEWDGEVGSVYENCYDLFYMPETFIDAPRALLDGNTSMYDMFDIDRKEGYPVDKPFVENIYLCQECIKTDNVKKLFSKKIEFSSYFFGRERIVKGWVCPTPQLIEQWRYKNLTPVTFEMMQEKFPDKKVY